ncbi:MAG TPA: glutamine amidotransferase, partial [Planctomycetota bacterium]|nr:glutamine amidotransferase [Planctomycetota bacterium]
QIVDESRISISVICYGAHGGMVPTNMEKLAARAGGRFHFLRGPEELPEIFLREASVVRKALVSEEPFQPALRTSHDILRGIQGLPGLDGHVLTSPRAGAELVLVRPSTAETPIDDPLLAAWTYSLGKVVAFTSDAGRRWGGQWTSWEGYGPYWSQLVRWVSRAEQSSFYRVDHRVEDGKLTVVAELITPDGRFVNGAALEGRVITPGRDGEVRRFELQQTGPGRYVGPELPLEQSGTYAVHLDAEVEGFALPYRFAVPLSYSPEYRALATDHDRLARIAEAGGGRVVSLGEPIDAFAGELPSRKSVEEVWRTLLLCALILFFLDVAVRRIAIDPRAAARRVHEWAHARALKRREATAPADERLSSLLRAKERVRESRFRDTRASGAGASVSTMSEGATSQTAVEEPVFDARDEARAS